MTQHSDINDPSLLGRNREPMHAPWEGDPTRRLSLDGAWRFHLAPRPEAVPADAACDACDDGGWALVQVPGNWELQGHGEAIYCNIAYPFHPDPPRAPAENPTGCYRTSFTLPADWSGSRVFIHFGSVDSSFHLWLNGREVGFSTDSKLPAEFELTHFLRPGRNSLALRCYRWGASAYLEKQDYWHLSGIQRSVTIFAKPAVHLRDWCVRTRFDAAFRDATLDLRVWMSRPQAPSAIIPKNGSIVYPACDGWQVEVQVMDQGGTAVGSVARAPVANRTPMYGGIGPEAFSAVFAIPVEAPRPWTPETPDLYQAELRLIAPDGQVADRERIRFGFRQVEIVEGIVRLNGQRLVVRGINRHEFHPRRGRAVTLEDMREDLLAMKRLNFNAVRTCHYPNDSRWYGLCDELGMAVVDEANLETHGLEGLTSKDPVWAGAYLERAIRMVLRDRNHPSVLFWSLGNESACGPHHAAMAAWIRHADPTRPVQYESGFPPASISDVLAPMYPGLDWVKRLFSDSGERRPMIMCEYAYAKGNSTGNVRKFWDMVREYPRFQGGFVWDWRDKVLALNQPDGGVRWLFGTAKDEPAHVERMCVNGVVGPDLVPHPGAWELKQAQAPVQAWASPADLALGRLWIQNLHQFMDLSHLRACWRVQDDGREMATGELALPALPPGASAAVHLDLSTLPAAGGERWLDIRFLLRSDCAWASAGYEISAAQFRLPVHAPIPLRTRRAQALRLDRRDGVVRAHGADFSAGFDQGLSSLVIGGRELLVRPVTACLHRAPTDIDWATAEGGHATLWRQAGLDRLQAQTDSCEAEMQGSDRAAIRIVQRLTASATKTCILRDTSYLVHGDGGIEISETMAIEAAVETLPRIGLELSILGACDHLRWYGRGPHENYPDRRERAFIDEHVAQVRDLLTPYLFPQECGLRCDVRWATITDAAGAGLRIEGWPLLHLSALPVRREDLAACANLADLKRRDETALHLDGFHAGLGGDTGWTRNIHPESLLRPGHYAWKLRLRGLSGA